MRRLGAVRFPDDVVNFPDYTILLPISTAGNGMDFPSGTNFIRISAATTAAAEGQIKPFLGLGTTGVSIPTSGVSSGTSSYIRVTDTRIIPTMGTTEFSLICYDSSGLASIECWK